MGEIQTNPIDSMMVRSFFDYSNGELTWKINKGRAKIGGKASINSTGYKVFKINQKTYLEHRLIWAWHFDETPMFLDHKNGNFLDNRIENLRPATHQQNMCNRKTPKHNKSGVKGVHRSGNKWVAQVTKNRTIYHLGRFDDLQDAKNAVMEKRKSMHQDFCQNGENL